MVRFRNGRLTIAKADADAALAAFDERWGDMAKGKWLGKICEYMQADGPPWRFHFIERGGAGCMIESDSFTNRNDCVIAAEEFASEYGIEVDWENDNPAPVDSD